MSDEKNNAAATFDVGVTNRFSMKIIPLTRIKTISARIAKEGDKCRLTMTGTCLNLPDGCAGLLKFTNHYEGTDDCIPCSVPVILRITGASSDRSYELRNADGGDLLVDPVQTGFVGKGIADISLQATYPYAPEFLLEKAVPFNYPFNVKTKKSDGDTIGSLWEVSCDYDDIFNGSEIKVSLNEIDVDESEVPQKSDKNIQRDYITELTWAAGTTGGKKFNLGCSNDNKLCYANEMEMGDLEIKTALFIKRGEASILKGMSCINVKKPKLESCVLSVARRHPGQYSGQPTVITSFSVKGVFKGFSKNIDLKVECTLLATVDNKIIEYYNSINQVFEVNDDGTFGGKLGEVYPEELPYAEDQSSVRYYAAVRIAREFLCASSTPVLQVFSSAMLPVTSLDGYSVVSDHNCWILSQPMKADGNSEIVSEDLVTIEQLIGIISGAALDDVTKYHRHINETLRKYEIFTNVRMAHFLCHIPVETGNLASVTQKSASSTYKGRGILQLTGEANYKKYAEYLQRDDVFKKPDLVAEPDLACDSAGWYWRYAWGTIDLNNLADQEKFIEIVKKINYKCNGLAERWEALKRAYRVLGVNGADTRLAQMRDDAMKSSVRLA